MPIPPHYPDDEPDERSLWQRIRDWWNHDSDRLDQISSDAAAIRAWEGMSDARYEQIVRKIDNMKEQLMGAVDDLKTELDAATTAIADRIERILQGQDAALVAALQPEIDRLKALGQDPAAPVPDVPPVDDPDEPAAPVDDGDVSEDSVG